MNRTATWSLVAGGLLLLVLGFWMLFANGAHAADRVAPDPAREILVLLRLPQDHYSPGSGYGGSYAGGEGRGTRRRFAETRARANGLELVDDWPMPMAGVDCFIMAVPDGRTTEDAAAALSRDPGVAWAEPVRTYMAQGAAAQPEGDPLYRVQPDALEWRLDALHRVATGRNVRVAVIDSAIEVGHPDLAGQVMLSENFVPQAARSAELHGTGVAGIIAAIAGNGKGIVGVAPRARLMALRACWQKDVATTLCDSLSLAKALYFAIEHDAEVINMSLSGPRDPLLGRLIDLAQAHGATVVGAVDPAQADGGFPASWPGVVAVIDETAAGNGAVFGAPGRDIPTTQPGGDWFFVSGSSYAAAHVSGLFALVRERSRKPQTASALATLAGSDTIDPCATLARFSAGVADCVSGGGALAARVHP